MFCFFWSGRHYRHSAELKTVDRYPSASLTVPLVVLSMSLFLLVPLCSSWLSLVPLLLLWGAAQTAICMALSASVLVVASDAADVATSLYSGIFNIGIGGGRLSDPSSRSISALRL